MNDTTTTTPAWILQVRALEAEFASTVADMRARGCTVSYTDAPEISKDEEGNITLTLGCCIQPPGIPEISEALSQLHVAQVGRIYYPPAVYVTDETGLFAFTDPFSPSKPPKAQP